MTALLARAAPLAMVAACSAPATRWGVVLPPAAPLAPRASAIDVEHYALELALDPVARTIDGECRVRFTAREDALRTVELDLRGLAVERVRDERGRVLAWNRDGERLSIALAAPLARGGVATVAVEYGGRPERGLWFSEGQSGRVTHVFTQGECDDARAWFPCVDDPSDRATSEIAVELPPGWTSIAAGEQVERAERQGGGAREHWRMSAPHPTYLATLVAGELAIERDEWNGVPLLYVAEPRHAAALRETFAATPSVIAFLSDLTGVRYPFPKYAQACVANFPFGGMENVSATTLTDLILTDERGRRDGDAVGLIVHEAAHQWFGDLLTCNDWSHVWLNEGFATYATMLYTEATRGAEEFRLAVRDAQDAYTALDVGERRRPTVWSICRDPLDLFFTGQAYQGAASRLHLLRFVVGDEAFFRGVRRYVEDNAGRGVVTADFRCAMEAESGADLGPFFETWFERAGYPELEVRWTWSERARAVELTVGQVQSPAGGTPAVFRAPIEIAVRDSAGVRVHRRELSRRRDVFTLDAAEKPAYVVLDPNAWLPKRARCERPLGEWLSIAAMDAGADLRREACLALGARLATPGGDGERGRAAQALIERLGGDPNRAVRAAAARALGGVRVASDHGIARALVEAARSDPEADVRADALDSLTRTGAEADEGLARFGRAEFEAGHSYATMAAAARLVARADPDGARAWIAERMPRESPHDAIRAGLLGALATLPGGDALRDLRSAALDASLSAAAREVAVRALPRVGKHVPAVARDVAALTEADDYHLQSAAIEALAQIGGETALRALAEHYSVCGDPRHERTIEAALRRGE